MGPARCDRVVRMTVSQALAVLGLQGNVTQGEVRRAYLDLVKVWHPDRFAGDARLQAKAQAQLKAINAAYDLLSAAWEHDTVPVAPASAPGPVRHPNPPSSSQEVRRSRPMPTWVVWAGVIAVSWAGALFTSSGGWPASDGASRVVATPQLSVPGAPAPVERTAAPEGPGGARVETMTSLQPGRQSESPTRPAAKPAPTEPAAMAGRFDDIIERVAEALRPVNGEEIDLASADGADQDRGLGRLNVENGTKRDGVMVLSRLGVARRAFYIRAGNTATLTDVGANSYEAAFMLGTGWDGVQFEADQQFLRFLKPMAFEERSAPDKITTSEISVTLHTVPEGNARTAPTPPFRLPVRYQ